jgi:hypothetical protein
MENHSGTKIFILFDEKLNSNESTENISHVNVVSQFVKNLEDNEIPYPAHYPHISDNAHIATRLNSHVSNKTYDTYKCDAMVNYVAISISDFMQNDGNISGEICNIVVLLGHSDTHTIAGFNTELLLQKVVNLIQPIAIFMLGCNMANIHNRLDIRRIVYDLYGFDNNERAIFIGFESEISIPLLFDSGIFKALLQISRTRFVRNDSNDNVSFHDKWNMVRSSLVNAHIQSTSNKPAPMFLQDNIKLENDSTWLLYHAYKKWGNDLPEYTRSKLLFLAKYHGWAHGDISKNVFELSTKIYDNNSIKKNIKHLYHELNMPFKNWNDIIDNIHLYPITSAHKKKIREGQWKSLYNENPHALFAALAKGFWGNNSSYIVETYLALRLLDIHTSPDKYDVMWFDMACMITSWKFCYSVQDGCITWNNSGMAYIKEDEDGHLQWQTKCSTASGLETFYLACTITKPVIQPVIANQTFLSFDSDSEAVSSP